MLLGMVVGLMIAQPGIDSSMENLREARSDLGDSMLSVANTDLAILGATFNNTTGKLIVRMEVTGAETVKGEDVDFLLDGRWVRSDPSLSGPRYPGESFDATFLNTTRPSSILIVGPYGLKWRIGAGSVANG